MKKIQKTVTETCECFFCGKDFDQQIGGRGRPRYFCTEDCSKAQRFMDGWLRQLDKIELTDSARKIQRGELLSLVNTKFHNNKRTKKMETV